MIGPHWFVSIFGIGLIGGVGIIMYINIKDLLPSFARILFLFGMIFTLVCYFTIVCKINYETFNI